MSCRRLGCVYVSRCFIDLCAMPATAAPHLSAAAALCACRSHNHQSGSSQLRFLGCCRGCTWPVRALSGSSAAYHAGRRCAFMQVLCSSCSTQHPESAFCRWSRWTEMASNPAQPSARTSCTSGKHPTAVRAGSCTAALWAPRAAGRGQHGVSSRRCSSTSRRPGARAGCGCQSSSRPQSCKYYIRLSNWLQRNRSHCTGCSAAAG